MKNPTTVLLGLALMLLSGIGAAQAQSPAVSLAPAGSLEGPRALADHLNSTFGYLFTKLETASSTPEVIQALSARNEARLAEMGASIQEQLIGSLRVRLYPADADPLDFATTPACGYACATMVERAGMDNPPAEALLYKTPEANITLVRGIRDNDGNHVGAVVAHYPYTLLQDAHKALTDTGLYSELRQGAGNTLNVLFKQGDSSLVEAGPASDFLRIDQTRLVIAVWTPGGVTVDKYEPPVLPLVPMAIAGSVLFVGIILLLVIRRKIKARKARKIKPDSEPAAERTLVFGGGATEVDISSYIKDDDITQMKNKLREDITDIKSSRRKSI